MMPQGWEWIIILAIGLLLFGKRLPEVGKSLGKGIVEFKKGIKGIDDEIEAESTKPRPVSRPAELSETQRRADLNSPATSTGSAPISERSPVEAIR